MELHRRPGLVLSDKSEQPSENIYENDETDIERFETEHLGSEGGTTIQELPRGVITNKNGTLNKIKLTSDPNNEYPSYVYRLTVIKPSNDLFADTIEYQNFCLIEWSKRCNNEVADEPNGVKEDTTLH